MFGSCNCDFFLLFKIKRKEHVKYMLLLDVTFDLSALTAECTREEQEGETGGFL